MRAYSRGLRNGTILQSQAASSSPTPIAIAPTPTPTRRLYSNTSTNTTNDGQSSRPLQRDFFTSHTTRRNFATTPSPQAKADPTISQHPLVKKLLTQIYCEGRTPDPEQTWQAYWSIFINVQEGGGERLAQRLPAQYHQLTLRAISPGRDKFIVRRRARLQRSAEQRQADEQFRRAIGAGEGDEEYPDLTSIRTHASTRAAKGSKKEQTDRAGYHDKVSFILDRLQACGVDLASATASSSKTTTLAYPSVEDYHHLLKHVVVSRDDVLFRAVWSRMQSQGLVLSNSPPSSTNKPTSQTYGYLIQGLLTHLNSQRTKIIRQQLHQGRSTAPSDTPVETQAGQHPARVQDETTNARFDEESADVANTVVALFTEMTKVNQIQPTSWIMDLVCQVMRVSGRFAMFQSVLMRAYGFDLQNLDAPAQDILAGQDPIPLKTKSVNTILMALGEKKSASEMVAVYEVLRWPLGGRGSVEQSQDGKWFETDFKGLLKADDEGVSSTDNPATPTAPPAPLPINGTTFQILLRNLCGNHRVSHTESTRRSELLTYTAEAVNMNLSSQSHAELLHRKRGGYVQLATHIASSAVDFYAEELRRIATELGYTLNADYTLAPDAEMSTQIPFYDPPRIQPTISLFTPLHKLCSNQRLVGAFERLLSSTDQSVSLLHLELSILQRAQQTIQSRITSLQSHPNPSVLPANTPSHLRSLIRLSRNLASQERAVSANLKHFSNWNTHFVHAGYEYLRERKYVERIKKKEQKKYEELKEIWRAEFEAQARAEGNEARWTF